VIIANPEEHEKFYTEQASRLISALNELLDRCTGGPVPDYMTFYGETGKLFNVGYSEKMFGKVAEIAAEFFANMQSSELSADTKQAWVRFQKFKLLFGFINQHMPEPASSLFSKAMGLD